MTERQKFRIAETKEELFARDEYTCQHCGASIYQYGTPQLAHLIAQTKANLTRYGKEIIHHKKNMAAVCCLKCNSALNIGGNPGKVKRLIEEIKMA